MHDALTIGVPVLAILAGNLFNRSDVKELRTEMRAGFDRVNDRTTALSNRVDTRFDHVEARFNRVDADLRQFYAVIGKLEGRIDEISKK